MAAHAQILTNIVKEASTSQKQAFMLSHTKILSNFIKDVQCHTLYLLSMLFIKMIMLANAVE